MFDRYDADNAGNLDPVIEEMMVDYVDGTMECGLRESFEEYLTQNPVLAEQVREMQLVRSMMCGLNCGCSAPPGFQARFRNRLACEMLEEDMTLAQHMGDHPSLSMVFSFMVVLVLISGLHWASKTEALLSTKLALEDLPSARTLSTPLPAHRFSPVQQSSPNWAAIPPPSPRQIAALRVTSAAPMVPLEQIRLPKSAICPSCRPTP